MVNVANLNSHMNHIKEAAYSLGFKKRDDPITSEEVLYYDMLFRILEIGTTVDTLTGQTSIEDKHKLMLQYTQLQKVVTTKQQTQAKVAQKNVGADTLLTRALSRKMKRIEEKVMDGQELDEDENEILDSAMDAATEEVAM